MVATTLLVQTARRRYGVRRDDLSEIQLLGAGQGSTPDDRLVKAELGAFFDAQDRSTLRRQRALIVPLRRRQIALLVDHVESLDEARLCPLPPLLQRRLQQPWAVGALVVGDQVVVQLDLRAVARSILVSLGSYN